ncbi:MAG TPA: hypothetical protein DCQ29_09610 [Chitinophagaceae bacterium]|nr:hypothetical protein [Chitinophagaceae bacterium]
MTTIVTYPEVKIEAQLKQRLNLQESNVTIVHCVYSAYSPLDVVRIWPSTVLIEDTKEERKLLQAYNISIAPEWTLVNGKGLGFTLIFEGLSKQCKTFSLDERIEEEGKFFVANIQRNSTDVYNIEVDSTPF